MNDTFVRIGALDAAELRECPECSAVVTWRNIPAHQAWHEQDSGSVEERVGVLEGQVSDLFDADADKEMKNEEACGRIEALEKAQSETDDDIESLQSRLSSLESPLQGTIAQIGARK